jgi:hypothetical protein
MSGDHIYGGTISGPNMEIVLTGTGVPTIRGTGGYIEMVSGNGGGFIHLSPSQVLVGTNGGSFVVGGLLDLTSGSSTGILTPSGYGFSGSFPISTPLGSRTLKYKFGILVSVS